jgi:hypothetical protein
MASLRNLADSVNGAEITSAIPRRAFYRAQGEQNSDLSFLQRDLWPKLGLIVLISDNFCGKWRFIGAILICSRVSFCW